MTSDPDPRAGAPRPATAPNPQPGPPPVQVWRWRYLDGEGRSVTTAGASPQFPAQADAESWVGEFWRDLVAAGVDAVTLTVDEEVVYGPMSLHPLTQ